MVTVTVVVKANDTIENLKPNNLKHDLIAVGELIEEGSKIHLP